MYICLDCGCIFESHKQCESELREHFGFPCREKWLGCPNCESWSTVETFRCKICNQYITDDYYEVGDIKICEDCCSKKTLDGGL